MDILWFFILLSYISQAIRGINSIRPVLSSSNSPCASIFASLSYDKAGNRVVLYGGTDIKMESIYSTLHSFDFDSFTWNLISSKSSLSPPSLHSSISFIHNNKYYLLFGKTENQIFPDCYSFDFQSREWSLVELKGEKFEVSVESANILFEFEKKSYLAIHGGVTYSGLTSDFYL